MKYFSMIFVFAILAAVFISAEAFNCKKETNAFDFLIYLILFWCPFSAACTEPKLGGDCRGTIPSYFYNQETRKCEHFLYGGCHGNENRFDSEEECNRECKN